jgi:hypothetical protein
MAFIGGKRRNLLILLIAVGFILILLQLPRENIRETIKKVPFAGKSKPDHESLDVGPYTPIDEHPISKLIAEADVRWRAYEGSRSMTFKDTVANYRRKYGRHPPPGFDIWYKYARERNVFHIDDFDQIMDDLRPFWAVEPKVIRSLAAHMSDDEQFSCAGIHIRNKKVVKLTNQSWRSETLTDLIERFIKYLPDMDIQVNRMDQPRVVVPWEDMQKLLAKEEETRQMPPEVIAEFTTGMSGLLNTTMEKDDGPHEDPGWFGAPGKQYMDIARTACPPEAHANERGASKTDAEATYKNRLGGIITNYNLSTDLCTVGPELQDQHGLLFSSSSLTATKRLVPVFGECKVNVNSDILFPANMYWMHDKRYDYDDSYDVDWNKKEEKMVWRGITSGGVQLLQNWRQFHRQRLVMLLNGTEMADQEVRVLAEQPEAKGEYENNRHFKPSAFAENYTDVGFSETNGCVPNCSFLYDNTLSMKEKISQAEQFKFKYLVDVDGHSFSGRWRAFLESKSLGFKATIFREWHDSRLFAWRHFVPMDNRFDDIYTLLTYFVGYGQPLEGHSAGSSAIYVARHDFEAQRIAQLSREWANKVLRRDDIEVCISIDEGFYTDNG